MTENNSMENLKVLKLKKKVFLLFWLLKNLQSSNWKKNFFFYQIEKDFVFEIRIKTRQKIPKLKIKYLFLSHFRNRFWFQIIYRNLVVLN